MPGEMLFPKESENYRLRNFSNLWKQFHEEEIDSHNQEIFPQRHYYEKISLEIQLLRLHIISTMKYISIR